MSSTDRCIRMLPDDNRPSNNSFVDLYTGTPAKLVPAGFKQGAGVQELPKAPLDSGFPRNISFSYLQVDGYTFWCKISLVFFLAVVVDLLVKTNFIIDLEEALQVSCAKFQPKPS